MIKITEIELIDFGRHRHIHQKLEGNVVGLTGANGRGKSTILQGIQFAITGTIDHPDPLSKFIRQGTRGGVAKSATVRLGFEVDGRKGSITRKITKTSTSRELTLEGLDGGPVSADKRVAEIMFQLLEVDKRALNSTVFIRQGAISDMFGKETDRREFYTRLLMLGHLAKIADVVDGYRKNVASSVMDLSAVLDEAETAQKEATDAFMDAEQRLSSTSDCTHFLTTATRLSFLFNDQSAASESIARELAKLGDDPEFKLSLLDSKIETARNTLTAISDQRLEHEKAKTRWSESLRQLSDAENLQRLHAELRANNQELAKFTATVATVDPAQEVTNLQRQVDACVVIAALEPQIPNLTFELDLLKAQVDGATKMVDDTSAEHDACRKVYEDHQKELSMRKTLLSGIAGHEHTAQCLLCGSASIDADYLHRTTSAIEVQATQAFTELSAAKTKLDSAKVTLNELVKQRDEKSTSLAAINSKVDSARVILGDQPADKDTIVRQLEETRVKANEYSIATAEVRRLTNAVTVVQQSLNGRSEPTEAELSDLRTLVHTTSAQCLPWNTELDAEEQRLKASIAQDQSTISVLQTAQTHLKSAREWLTRTETELNALCIGDVQALPDEVYVKGSVVTSSVAEDMVSKLQAMQTEYDHLKGMREAARSAMSAAQRRVIDTETKIENQQQRITLVERLSALQSAFKPTGVSLDYLDYKFSQVASVASDYLAESGADFTVVASETEPLAFDFIRMEPGEEWLSQSRLSGGQRVRLAVATLRAIHSLVVPNVGLLVLDEPTTHLDHEAKLAMAEMLRRIGNEGGLQILVCDHDPILIDAFSSTIEIPE